MTLLDILAPLPQFRSLKKAQDFLDELRGRGYSLSITITDKPFPATINAQEKIYPSLEEMKKLNILEQGNIFGYFEQDVGKL